MIQVAIVDDKQINRQTIQGKLARHANLSIAFEAKNGQEFLEKMELTAAENLPQIVLMDLDMPKMNGIEAIAMGSTLYPNTKFIVLTVFDDDNKIFDAIQAGASGYLLKEDTTIQLIEAITQAYENTGAPMSPSIARKTLFWVKNNLPLSSTTENKILSEREMEILRLVTQGKDYKTIAEDLFISPLTVRTHISKIYEKLHVHSKAQAIQMAHKMKWL